MVDSIAYGESLLSDIRARNDKLRKQAEKDARKKEWTNMAVNIGKSVFTDIYAEKQNRLMQNEDVVANKLLMQNVNDKHKAFAAEIREADKVGRDTYYYDQVDKLMDAQLRDMYGAQGTYNESNFQTLKAKMVKGYLIIKKLLRKGKQHTKATTAQATWTATINTLTKELKKKLLL